MGARGGVVFADAGEAEGGDVAEGWGGGAGVAG